jgi:Mg2+-importing ATPase
LIEAIFNPFSIILIIIAVLDASIPQMQDWPSFGIIIGILLITSFIRMFQEIRSNKASEKLHDMIETTAAIERDGIKKEIPIDEIVPGDIVHLAAGDMVPADLRILTAKDLFITQSALTGESEPVEKMSEIDLTKEYKNALEVNNLCFMGTSVSSGSAKALVLNTGNNTFFGRIARSISKKRPKTNFDKGIRSVSLLLLITTIIMVVVVFALQGGLGVGENR